MPAKLTQAAAIAKVRDRHGDLYDLSRLEYVASKYEVQVGCRKHGFFSICFRDFTKSRNARGCQACGKEIYDAEKGDVWNKIDEATALARMKETHGDKFDYSGVIYLSYTEPVLISCSLHGAFKLTPKEHVFSQYGCPICARAASTANRINDYQKNVDNAKYLFGNKYDYSPVPRGICSKTKFTLVCNSHGAFTKTWNEHLSGDGCPECSMVALGMKLRSNTDEFISKAEKIHGQQYDYSAVDYQKTNVKVEIRCREHGAFMQKPNKHLSGRGCRHCAKNGFRTLKEGYLYILKDEDITKVGITNRKVSERLKEINYSGKNFNIVYTRKYASGQDCFDAEFSILKYLRLKYKTCQEKFNGSTECFISVDLADLKDRIEMEVEIE